MAISQKELFKLALGLEDPWVVESLVFNPEKKELHIHVGFWSGSRFDCSSCGKKECLVHDTVERVWRHLNFFQFEAFIHCRLPRTGCGDCGIKQVSVPWARKHSGFTLLMDSFILLLSQSMPVKKVAEIVGENDTRIWRVLEYYVTKARGEEDFSEVYSVGVDETSVAPGHEYLTVFADLENSKVLYVCKGKDSATVESFKKDYIKHQGIAGNVENFCCDMSPAFISGIETHFERASITFDRFHVVKIVNDAVDGVRREEQRDKPVLKNSRYAWLKNPANRTKEQENVFNSLSKMRLKTSRAYQVKMSLSDFWNLPDAKTGKKYFKKWYYWATHTRLQPIVDAAKTLKRHEEGIINFLNTRISNGVMEGINSVIQSIKTAARGFRNVKYFQTAIYLKMGKLTFDLPDLTATHTK